MLSAPPLSIYLSLSASGSGWRRGGRVPPPQDLEDELALRVCVRARARESVYACASALCVCVCVCVCARARLLA